MKLNTLVAQIKSGQEITEKGALYLLEEVSLETLLKKAKEIKDVFLVKHFEFCSIINAKSGACSEDCKFCAQSSHYNTGVETYALLSYDVIKERAEKNQAEGIEYFSLVTTGKGLTSDDFDQAVKYIERLKRELSINICASFGILSFEQFKQLKDAGLDRYHHNLETSKEHYEKICTTHGFSKRIETIKKAKEAGLDVCAGGIMGLGETYKDLIHMAFELRSLEVKSIPVNVLNPVKNTPLQNLTQLRPEEILRRLAVLRFIFPKATLRLAAGRIALKDRVEDAIKYVMNASITGDLLTTTGSNIKKDFELIKKAGY